MPSPLLTQIKEELIARRDIYKRMSKQENKNPAYYAGKSAGLTEMLEIIETMELGQ